MSLKEQNDLLRKLQIWRLTKENGIKNGIVDLLWKGSSAFLHISYKVTQKVKRDVKRNTSAIKKLQINCTKSKNESVDRSDYSLSSDCIDDIVSEYHNEETDKVGETVLQESKSENSKSILTTQEKETLHVELNLSDGISSIDDKLSFVAGRHSNDELSFITGRHLNDGLICIAGRHSNDGLSIIDGRHSSDELSLIAGRHSSDELSLIDGRHSNDELSFIAGRHSSDGLSFLAGRHSSDELSFIAGRHSSDELSFIAGRHSNDELSLIAGRHSSDGISFIAGRHSSDGLSIIAGRHSNDEFGLIAGSYSKDEPSLVVGSQANMNDSSMAVSRSTDEHYKTVGHHSKVLTFTVGLNSTFKLWLPGKSFNLVLTQDDVLASHKKLKKVLSVDNMQTLKLDGVLEKSPPFRSTSNKKIEWTAYVSQILGKPSEEKRAKKIFLKEISERFNALQLSKKAEKYTKTEMDTYKQLYTISLCKPKRAISDDETLPSGFGSVLLAKRVQKDLCQHNLKKYIEQDESILLKLKELNCKIDLNKYSYLIYNIMVHFGHENDHNKTDRKETAKKLFQDFIEEVELANKYCKIKDEPYKSYLYKYDELSDTVREKIECYIKELDLLEYFFKQLNIDAYSIRKMDLGLHKDMSLHDIYTIINDDGNVFDDDLVKLLVDPNEYQIDHFLDLIKGEEKDLKSFYQFILAVGHIFIGNSIESLLQRYKAAVFMQVPENLSLVVVSAAVFETALRQWQIDNYKLTSTNYFPKYIRMFLSIPVYLGGLINRRDEKDRREIQFESKRK